MAKYRIYEIAEEIGVDSGRLVEMVLTEDHVTEFDYEGRTATAEPFPLLEQGLQPRPCAPGDGSW